MRRSTIGSPLSLSLALLASSALAAAPLGLNGAHVLSAKVALAHGEGRGGGGGGRSEGGNGDGGWGPRQR